MMTVTLYMKSGNQLVSDCVTKYTFTPSPTGVSKIDLAQSPGPNSTAILTQALDVGQIEGMTVHDGNLPQN
jgi:hypothetical protein